MPDQPKLRTHCPQIEELVSGGAEEVAREEARLRTENEKLRYRLNILQRAVARETENTTGGRFLLWAILSIISTFTEVYFTLYYTAVSSLAGDMARCFLCRVETDSKCERCGLPACPAHLPSHSYQVLQLFCTVLYTVLLPGRVSSLHYREQAREGERGGGHQRYPSQRGT